MSDIPVDPGLTDPGLEDQGLLETAVEASFQAALGSLSEANAQYCSACKAYRDPTEFDGRKVCARHRPGDSEQPVPVPYAALKAELAADNARTGLRKFEAVCRLSELPGYVPGGDTQTVRGVRDACRPLIDLIQDATGYVFVFKDGRAGKKLKYAYSLRYMCAQRETRRSKGAPERSGGPERSEGAPAERSEDTRAGHVDSGNGGPGDDPVSGEADHAPETTRDIETLTAMVEKDGRPTSPAARNATLAGDAGEVAGDEPIDIERITSAWSKNLISTMFDDIESEQSQSEKRRPKRMARFDCRGGLVVNVFHDSTTVHFAITHHLQHPEYVDVVGNRFRGSRRPTLRGVYLPGILREPTGTVDIAGKDAYDTLQKTLSELAATARLVRSLRGAEGLDSILTQMYDATAGARSLRVSIMEALERSHFDLKGDGGGGVEGGDGDERAEDRSTQTRPGSQRYAEGSTAEEQYANERYTDSYSLKRPYSDSRGPEPPNKSSKTDTFDIQRTLETQMDSQITHQIAHQIDSQIDSSLDNASTDEYATNAQIQDQLPALVAMYIQQQTDAQARLFNDDGDAEEPEDEDND